MQASPSPSLLTAPGLYTHILRKPVSGPFYITPLTLDQLRASLVSTSRILKVGGGGGRGW